MPLRIWRMTGLDPTDRWVEAVMEPEIGALIGGDHQKIRAQRTIGAALP
jgi:hypothetical protein